MFAVTSDLEQILSEEMSPALSIQIMEECQNAVLAGIEWFETQGFANWHVEALKDGFDMTNNQNCLFGRITKIGFNAACEKFCFSDEKCRNLGFLGDFKRGVCFADEQYLEQLWRVAAEYTAM